MMPTSPSRTTPTSSLAFDLTLPAGPSPRQPAGGPVSATAMQMRLWLLDQLVDGAGGYNIFSAYEIDGEVDIARLQHATEVVRQRHECLRTRFRQHPGQGLMQEVVASSSGHCVVEADTSEDPAQQAAWVKALLARERSRRFALDQAPPWRLTVVRLGAQRTLLCLCFHHILLDGFSAGTVLSDLCDAYAGRQLAPLALQFADCVAWDLAQDPQAAAAATQRAIQRLEGAQPLPLPYDLPDAAEAAEAAEAQPLHFALDASEAELVNAAAQQLGASPFVVLGALYAITLAVFCDRRDIVLGTSIQTREGQHLAGVAGLFVELLPIRCDLGPDSPLRSALSGFRQAWLDALNDRKASFQDTMAAQRGAGHKHGQPLISAVITVFLAQQAPALSLDSMAVRQVGAQTEARFDLELMLRPESTGYSGLLVYAPERFGPATMRSFVHSFLTLVRCLGSHMDLALAELPLASPPEHSAPQSGVGALAPLPSFERFHLAQRFEQVAAQHPERIALTCGGEHLSYAQLDQWSDRVAQALLTHGCRRGELVGLCMERSLGLLAGMLGILKAGAAYVPLDPRYPPQRLAMMCEDVAMQLCVTDAAVPELPWQGMLRIEANTLRPVAGSSEAQPKVERAHLPERDASDLAYVLFTSGSTGRPKGVKVTHANVARLLTATRETFGFNQHDVWCLFHSYAFDVSVWEIFGAFLHGGRLLVVPYEVSRDPASFADLALGERLTVLNQTPSAFSQTAPALLAHPQCGQTVLRHVIFAGEALDLQALGPWIRQLGDERAALTNMYGITETTVHVTARRIRAADLLRRGSAPIGPPMADLSLCLVNAALRPVPRGAVGEILVGGAGVSAGYWRRPDLDAERFVPDDKAGTGRAYRSGDLARINARGELVCLGRRDHQVKLRGFRIELGEIKAALLALDSCASAEVLLRHSADGDARLVAYVTPGPGLLRELQGQQVAGWQRTFDEVYAQAPCDLDRPDFTGWTSSHDGQPIPPVQMQAWLDETIERIQALGARRILEIGCGTGMLLARLAPDAERYVAIDPSDEVIGRLQPEVTRRGWDHVRLMTLTADALALAPERLAAEPPFDLILINSVIQYFPSADYLQQVIGGLLPHAATGAHLFAGDLRAHASLEVHHLGLALRGTPGQAGGTHDLQARAAAFALRESELVVDPGFLQSCVPPARRAVVWPRLKAHSADNELSRLRYDAIVALDVAPDAKTLASTASPNAQHIDGTAFADSAALARWMQRHPTRTLVVEGLCNTRVAAERAAQRPDDAPAPHFEPGELMALCSGAGRAAATWWSGSHSFSLVVGPVGAEALLALATLAAPWPRATNHPVQRHAPQRADTAILRRLRETLPEHQVPSAVVVLPRLPLTPTGKLDSSALPDPFAQSAQAPEAAVDFGDDEVLARVCAITGQLLGVPTPDGRQDFFLLGGHSLLATRLMAQLQEAFGVAPSLRELFAQPQLAAIAQRVREARDVRDSRHAQHAGEAAHDAAQGASHGAVRPGPQRLPPGARSLVLASPSQASFYLLHQLQPLDAAYHISVTLRLRGPLDLPALQAALRSVAQRHESLRTRFRMIGAQLHQEVLPLERCAPLVEQQAALGADLAHCVARVQAFATQPLLLSEGPALRVLIVQRAADEHLLSLLVHHIHLDGQSAQVVMRDLSQAYSDHRLGRTAAQLDGHTRGKTDDRLQPVDVAHWLNTGLDAGRREQLRAFWRAQLAQPPQPLPRLTHGGAPAPSQPGVGEYTAHVPAALWRQVRLRSSQLGLSPYACLLGAWACALWRRTGVAEQQIGSVLSLRDRQDLQEVVMPLLNTLPVRLHAAAADDADHFLRSVASALLAATEHADLPVDEIAAQHAPQLPAAERPPLFQTLVTWQAFAREDLTLADLDTELLPLAHTAAKADLALMVAEQAEAAGGAVAQLVYRLGACSGEPAQALLDDWQHCLHALAHGQAIAAQAADTAEPTPLAAPLAAPMPAPELVTAGPGADDATLMRLLQVWRNTLRQHDLGPDDDLIARGVSSLACMGIASVSSEVLGQRVPVATLLASRTCRQLLHTLSAAVVSKPHEPSINPMAAPTGQPPLILLPDISGQMLALTGLARLLAPHFDVLGLEIPKHLRGVRSFSELLRAIVRAVRVVQPQGPYRFLGYSYGGLLAAHVAARLEAIGEEVAFLGVLDAVPQGNQRTLADAADTEQTWTHFAQVLLLHLSGQSEDLEPQLFLTMTDSQRASWLYARLQARGVPTDGLAAQDIEGLYDTYQQLTQLQLPAFPSLDNPVVVWRTARLPDAPPEPAWGDFASRLDLRACSGQHHTMLSPPHLASLASDIVLAMKAEADA